MQSIRCHTRFFLIMGAFVFWGGVGMAVSQPNILILLADDLGYADLGCQGCRDIPTPHIDSIAAHGVRFTEAYVPGPQCVPSRMALMSGRYPQRGGSIAVGGMSAGTENGLSLEETTLADRLRAVGYTSIALGKWHLGELDKFQPQSRGFDEFYGFLAGMHDYVKADDKHWGPIMDGKSPGKLEGYLTEVLADRAVDFIRRRQKAGGPWFVYLAFNAVHTPMQAPEDKLQKFAHIPDKTRRTYAAMVSALDDAVGRVLDVVRGTGAERDTLIFFLSDNGGPLPGHAGANGALNTPLRGSKLEVWEGGVRVPLFMQWTGRIPPGRSVDGMVSSMDVTATAVAVAGADPKAGKPLDGFDLMPLADGKSEARRHDALFFQFDFKMQQGVRMGDWKWVHIPKSKPPRGAKGQPAKPSPYDEGTGLFNLREDIGETRDLSAKYPERLKQLRDAFNRWSVAVTNQTVAVPAAAKPSEGAPFSMLELNRQCAPTRKVVYKRVDGVDLELHIFEPENFAKSQRRPAYVVFHGGGWTANDPSRFYAIADYHARRLGMVGISVQYRLTKNPVEVAGVERCVRDARSALRYIRSHAAELGVDPTRIVAAGGSAGGHLAAATALMDGMDDPTDDLQVSCRPDALLLYFPALDFSVIPPAGSRTGADWERISPSCRVKPGAPPTLVFQGTADIITPLVGAQTFQTAMRQADNNCETVAYADGAHGYFLKNREHYESTLSRGEGFLRELKVIP